MSNHTTSNRPHRVVKRLRYEELQQHVEQLLNEVEEENEGCDFDDDSNDDYVPPDAHTSLSSSNISGVAANSSFIFHREESDAESEIILEEDDIRDDVEEEGVVYEDDFQNDLDVEQEAVTSQQDGAMVAKDNIAWLTECPIQAIRVRAHNVFRDTAVGPSRATKGLSESAVFDLIFTPSMLEQVLMDTNEKAIRTFQMWNENNPTANERVWSKLTYIELRAFVGLLLLAGVNKSSDEDIDVLWSKDSVCYYRATMSKSRFKEILRFIRFDNCRTRSVRLESDKAAPISVLWAQMNSNLRKYYVPSGEITVDEQLFPYRGRTRFTQYIPSKPAKYGIKVWFACDANSFYPLNSEIYAGKSSNASRAVNVGESVVQKLVVHWENTGRTIICDNFFTSLNLAEYLMSKGLALLGTVRQNKRFVPNEMKPNRRRPEESTIFGFLETKFALVSYVPKKGRAVILLSTTPLTNAVVPEKKNKPQYILDYNKTKGGVDAMDKMLSAYTTKRKTLRWPLAMFYNMLDISALAAYIIYSENHSYVQQTDKRRKFLRSLAKQLFIPAIEQRIGNSRVLGNEQTRLAIHMALGYSPKSADGATLDALPDVTNNKNQLHPVRCQYCDIGKRKSTRKICSWCKKAVCDTHSLTYTLGKCCSVNKN